MQQAFPHWVFLGFILGFFELGFCFLFLSFKKKLSKNPIRAEANQHSLLRTFKPGKKKYHRETNRGSRSKNYPSQPRPTTVTAGTCVSAPLTRLGAPLTTSLLSTAACAREPRPHAGSLPSPEKGLGPPAAILKGNDVWIEVISL